MKGKIDQSQGLLPLEWLVQCSDAHEAAEEQPACDRIDHHLHYEKGKGWIYRVVVDVGKKVIGKRLKFRLGTTDLREACKRRDLVTHVLEYLGLKVCKVQHPPHRPKKDNPNNNRA